MFAVSALADAFFMLLYDVVLWFFDAVIHTFFREVRSVGSFHIPKKGPVIFVCAPHRNLFIDPVVLMMTNRKESGRRISLLTAAKTYRTWHIGTAARLCSAIPVERAQDLVKPYEGTIRVENFGRDNDNLVILGEGTNFTKDAETKGIIGLQGYLGNAKIKSVESDTRIILQKPFQVKFDKPSDKDKKVIDALKNGYQYVLAPHIDNQRTFQKVFDHLLKGKSLGIFPEGGSHDRTTSLPLKPGVALMALGAASHSDDPNIVVNIVPVGLNYFNADRFRSSVVIEYGEPIAVTKNESAEYEQNSREVVNRYLETITLKLQEVTVTCKDIDTLTTIQAARRLYAPTERDSTSLAMKVEMNRRLIKGYEKFSDRPEIQELRSSVENYNKKLKQLGLHDHQVETLTKLNRWSVLVTFTGRLLRCLVAMCLSLPGFVMFSPVFLVASHISRQKAKQALASSVVKIKGKDVIASWKILVALGLAPMLYIFWAVIATHLLFSFELTSQTSVWVVFVICYLLNVLITYSSLRTGELGFEYFVSLKPLAYSLFSENKDMEQIAELKTKREHLAQKVTTFCEQYGPSMFDDYSNFLNKYKSERATIDDANDDSNTGVFGGENKSSSYSLADIPIFSHASDDGGFVTFHSEDESKEQATTLGTKDSEEYSENSSEFQIRLRKPLK